LRGRLRHRSERRARSDPARDQGHGRGLVRLPREHRARRCRRGQRPAVRRARAVERMAAARGGVDARLEVLTPRWDGPIIVAAPGPSLTREVAEVCRDYPTIAIKQAALRIPWATVMYACNAWQWEMWNGFPQFEGERWSCHHRNDRKDWIADRFGLRLVRGE